jgi:hypothetical protein
MLEVLFLIWYTGRIGALVEAKGRRSGWLKALTVLFWIGGEVLGAVGAVVLGQEGLRLYGVALAGACFGAGVAYTIARSLPAVEPGLAG